MIYLDNAATSFPKPETVYRAVDHFNREVGANPGRSGYAAARRAVQIVEETRAALAQLFNVDKPSQIIFASNATEALNLALKGFLHPGDHVVTSVADHNSVLRPLRSLEERGQVNVTRVVCDATGLVDPEDVRAALTPETKLVCVTHASNVTGAIIDVKAIATLVHENGTTLMVDAAQTAGCVPIDVQDMQIDLLAFTGHKGLLGPQGTGGLYVKPGLEVQIQPFCEGGTGYHKRGRASPDSVGRQRLLIINQFLMILV